jgi:hypothetical protein
MKRIKIGTTHDTSDCTTTGYTIDVGRQGDGDYMIILTGNSRWQGSTDNEQIQIRSYATEKVAVEAAEFLLANKCEVIGEQLYVIGTGPSRPQDYDGYPMVRSNGGYTVK